MRRPIGAFVIGAASLASPHFSWARQIRRRPSAPGLAHHLHGTTAPSAQPSRPLGSRDVPDRGPTDGLTLPDPVVVAVSSDPAAGLGDALQVRAAIAPPCNWSSAPTGPDVRRRRVGGNSSIRCLASMTRRHPIFGTATRTTVSAEQAQHPDSTGGVGIIAVVAVRSAPPPDADGTQPVAAPTSR